MKVFLGGTCNNSTWRDELIPMLECDYFNPVVDDWTIECQQRELYEREISDFTLYVITNEMTGVYSIAEVVDDSNKKGYETLLFIDYTGFSGGMKKSLKAVENMVDENGGIIFTSLKEVAHFLNTENRRYIV